MQNILIHANEYAEFDGITYEAKTKLMSSCNDMLTALHVPEEPKEETKAVDKPSSKEATKKKKPRRSILFGALMGLACACWVFSGNYIFTGLFTSMTILGQLEYYRMVMNTGVYAARRISVIGAASMFVTVSEQET